MIRTAIALTLMILLMACSRADGHIFSFPGNEYVTFAEMVGDLNRSKVIFIGESHDNPHHHRAQLEIIMALQENGADLAIGLEMFRSDSQETLNRWVAGELPFVKFIEVYRDNWQWWEVYSNIFNYAREKRIPMIGLNLSRAIVSKVAQNGFDSLSPEEMADLPIVRCIVDDTYRDYIRRALGKHDLTGTAFNNFCEAQLLWDKMMAENLHDYLHNHPEKMVVVLTGQGHAWKYGIPEQLKNKGEKSWRVILPEIPGHTNRRSVSAAEADYLLLGVEQSSLH